MNRLIKCGLLLAVALCPLRAPAQAFSFADIPFLGQGVPAPSGYTPVSGLIDDDSHRGAGLTGAADSKTGIISFWYKANTDDELERTLFVGNYPAGGFGDVGIHIYRLTDQCIFIDLYNAAGTRIMAVKTPSTWGGFFAGDWRHLICSWDLAATNCVLYLDGLQGEAAYEMTDDTINYTVSDWWFGSKSDVSDPTDACISEFYLNFGEFLDLSDAGNRAKFYLNGGPVDLGATGSLPTGTAPEVYFRTWTGANAGTGGDFIAPVYSACDTPTNPPYAAVAATFDGANDYMLRGGGLTGAADSKVLTVSFWAKFNEDGSDYQTIFVGNYPGGGTPGVGIFIYRLASQRIYVECYNAAGTQIFKALSHASVPFDVASGWRHFMCSVNLATAAQHIYVDGANHLVTDTLTDDTIDYTQTQWCIGAVDDGTFKTDCCLSELYINIAEYVDLSDAGNRARFYNAGEPVDLGSDGSFPTGTAPTIYMKAWTGANAGSGGNFAITGSLDTCTPP